MFLRFSTCCIAFKKNVLNLRQHLEKPKTKGKDLEGLGKSMVVRCSGVSLIVPQVK